MSPAITAGELTYAKRHQIEWDIYSVLPMVEINSVGQGGGSIAWMDAAGALQLYDGRLRFKDADGNVAAWRYEVWSNAHSTRPGPAGCTGWPGWAARSTPRWPGSQRCAGGSKRRRTSTGGSTGQRQDGSGEAAQSAVR